MNCKPGELAFIVGGRYVENIGIVVRCLHVVQHGDRYRDGIVCKTLPTPTWLVRSEGRPLVLERVRCGRSQMIRAMERPINDRFLRPIRPAPDLMGVRVDDEVTA